MSTSQNSPELETVESPQTRQTRPVNPPELTKAKQSNATARDKRIADRTDAIMEPLEHALRLADVPVEATVCMATPVRVPQTEASERGVATRHKMIERISRGLVMLDRVMGDRVREGFGILMYHRCCPVPDGVAEPTLNVTPDQLASQLAGLQERGFQFRSLPSVLSDLEAARPIHRKTVVVTFDDGFAGVHRYALPVLQRLKIPASVFVCTGMLGRQGPMPFDPWGRDYCNEVGPDCIRSLSISECEELIESGLIDLGSHTHSHADFRGRPGDLFEDLWRGAETLQRRFNISNPTFAFPFGTPSLGYADDGLIRAAQLAGMRCGLTTESRINSASDDPFGLGRLNVFNWDTADTLQARLHGWYSWLPRISGAMRRLRFRTQQTDESSAINGSCLVDGGQTEEQTR